MHDLLVAGLLFVSTGATQLLNGGTFTKAALLSAVAAGAGAVVHSLLTKEKP